MLAALAALGVGAAGGFMNLEVAGISDAAMPMALAIGLLEVAGSEALAGKSQTSVGSGSSLLFLAGVGSGGAFIHCHLFSSQDNSSAYGMGGWSPGVYGAAVALAVDVVVLLGVGADVASGLALADAVNVVAVGGGVLLAVAVEVVDAGAFGGGGSGCWPHSGSYGWCCLYHTRWAWESH